MALSPNVSLYVDKTSFCGYPAKTNGLLLIQQFAITMTDLPNSPVEKTNYGIDAPGVIRNIFIGSFMSILLAIFALYLKNPYINIQPVTFLGIGLSCALSGFLMLLYSLYGKYKYRNHLLNLINWTGREQVLDIGTGRGLLMVGAAKRLTSGRSIGIDIWNQQDLTKNEAGNALKNARLEGVLEKVQVESQNVMSMNFSDECFDVVLSNLCLHNIYQKDGRKKACHEIYRVLKPGGMAVISDFRYIHEYRATFSSLGMRVAYQSTGYFNTFPPLTVIKVVKQLR